MSLISHHFLTSHFLQANQERLEWPRSAAPFAGILHTAEMRWFLRESDAGGSATWQRWLAGDGSLTLRRQNEKPGEPGSSLRVQAEKAREDVYFKLPGCETLGIKQRGGSLEVKARIRPPERWSLPTGTGAAGFTDAWIKWTLPPQDEDFSPRLGAAELWRAVNKRRWLVQAVLEGSRLVRPARSRRGTDSDASAGGPPGKAEAAPAEISCQFEVTEVHVLEASGEAARWMTAAIEVSGAAAGLDRALPVAAGLFFEDRGPPPAALAEAASCSYPAWLARME